MQTSIRKNFTYSTFYQILTVITPFITSPYVSRVLGPEGVGTQSYTEANLGYFALFATLGTATYGARVISQSRDNPEEYSKYFWEIELVSVISGLICLAAWIIFAMTHPEFSKFYMILSLNLVATILDISWFFNGLEQIKSIVIRGTILKITGVVLTFLFIKTADDLLLYMGISSVTGTLAIISYWFQVGKFLVPIDRKSINLKPHFKQTLIYFVPTIATSIYTVLDKTLIGVITDETSQNGYYSRAENIINIAKSVTYVSVNTVVGIRASYLFAEKKFDEVKSRIKTSMDVIMFMGLGCMFGIIGVAKNLVPVFFGENYGPVESLLYAFAPIVVIIGISNCLETHYYIPIGKRSTSTKFLIVGAAANLVMNLILIPKFGAFGAVVATVASELIITLMFFAFCDGYLTVRILAKTMSKKFVAGIIMCVIVHLIGELGFIWGPFRLAAQVIGGAVIYVLLLLAFRDSFVVKTVKEVLGKKILKK